MKRFRISIFILICVIILAVFTSFLIYKKGITKKIVGLVKDVNTTYDKKSYGNYPTINYVYNSGGQNVVNTDVILTINVVSIHKINKLQYSYDLKKWNNINIKKNKNDITSKIIFRKTMDKDIYIRAINEKGYKSYPYKTSVKIDKIKPLISLNKTDSYYFILKDNYNLKKIQYSMDNKKWFNEDINGKLVTIKKILLPYKYVRVVDEAGNISNILKIN